MNHKLLLLFFFLASISVINAVPHFIKRATEFNECPPIPKNPINVMPLTVTVAPDPIVSNQDATFTITGTAQEDIPTTAEISIVYNSNGGPVIGAPFVASLCANGDPCSIKSGDTFTRKFTAATPELPTPYTVTILINTSSPQEPGYGCAVATVGA